MDLQISDLKSHQSCAVITVALENALDTLYFNEEKCGTAQQAEYKTFCLPILEACHK